MENSQSTSSSVPWGVIVGIMIVIIAILWFVLSEDEVEPIIHTPVVEEPIVEPTPEPEIIEPEVVEPAIEEEVIEKPASEPASLLPTLDESDAWLEEKLPTITWRKELLKLVIDDDMIRRFVVFTDNFSQGILAYEHSPLIKPTSPFSGREINENGNVIIKWDDTSSRRFSLYVDLLRSVDSETLVSWYFELKPLVDEAYQELGYPEEDFTDILQDAITKVLDMEIPKEQIELVRPSVMYQFKDEDIESLDDAEKLMLRLGKENLLVIKSVLLEISEKIARENN
ncbi:DUF3014 domain-containing protein [Thalassotalea castellviae]|uniref:DUF3014 domain-containing protein n=1 Tax=Thalassotalea castellviae TaxID=3075612 RepID=A0ABU3A0I5_9GAMM|nr:DUF3014 domain-containing protein [Thalassotalea sp. W431]MDT0602638.1 DUF3014 domain-containing protein [Thalassotalea sp. W431]